jgi:serine/threonine protein kinase
METLLTPDQIDEIQTITLTDRIGRGHFGEVFKIMYKGKPYAIKKIDPELPSTFYGEVSIHKELSSNPATKNYVPTFYGSYKQKDGNCIIMEYLVGMTLNQLCASVKLSDEEIEFIFSEIKKILHAFHASGIAFLDLFGDNIFIEIENNQIKTVKLIDFGMSKKLGEPGWLNDEIVSTSQNMESYDSLKDLFTYCVKKNSNGKGNSNTNKKGGNRRTYRKKGNKKRVRKSTNKNSRSVRSG